ncbi:MTA/SAH nucleosidase [Dissulfurispira thermophila]|uniref:Futalosine hydrolase n=2 Tax=root TaxID=1 RepID=A0A7G1GYT2_9BACT|nr:futalosine hydrolase [Dissulfurispira thermophila]BCB95378.1 MTA/SAH nucleosidase [Dissulfurispira thermophila]
MPLGIITSTQIEADLVTRLLIERNDFFIQGKYFYKGILGQNTDVVVCICGVGKANAAHGTTLLIERFKIDTLYVIGVGGAYPSSGLKIGDIVIAEKEIYGDEGLATRSGVKEKNKINFYTMDKINIPLCIADGIEYYNEFPMSLPKKVKIQSSDFKVKTGNFITVSTCTGILERGMELEKRFDAICENMEGAAVAHICALSKIPVIEIRGISNIIDDRAAEPLSKIDIIKAAENAQRFLLQLI